MNRFIEIQDMETYFHRLTWKPAKRSPFIYDYIAGDGDELASKFWNTKSSSRLAFDMWSWLVDHASVKSIAFERKLPGVIASYKGPAGVPNMDIFLSTESTLLYVESKFTEIPRFVYKGNARDCLSAAYWSTEKHGGLFPSKRFYNEQYIFNCFSEFVDSIQHLVETNSQESDSKWFDAKQETCHLFGIIFDLLGAGKYETGYAINPQPNSYKGKKAILLNVACNMMGDEIDNPRKDSLPELFRVNAEKMVNSILQHYGYEKEMFSYRFMSYESLLRTTDFLGCFDFTKATAYGYDASVVHLYDDYSWAENFSRGKL